MTYKLSHFTDNDLPNNLKDRRFRRSVKEKLNDNEHIYYHSYSCSLPELNKCKAEALREHKRTIDASIRYVLNQMTTKVPKEIVATNIEDNDDELAVSCEAFCKALNAKNSADDIVAEKVNVKTEYVKEYKLKQFNELAFPPNLNKKYQYQVYQFCAMLIRRATNVSGSTNPMATKYWISSRCIKTFGFRQDDSKMFQACIEFEPSYSSEETITLNVQLNAKTNDIKESLYTEGFDLVYINDDIQLRLISEEIITEKRYLETVQFATSIDIHGHLHTQVIDMRGYRKDKDDESFYDWQVQDIMVGYYDKLNATADMTRALNRIDSIKNYESKINFSYCKMPMPAELENYKNSVDSKRKRVFHENLVAFKGYLASKVKAMYDTRIKELTFLNRFCPKIIIIRVTNPESKLVEALNEILAEVCIDYCNRNGYVYELQEMDNQCTKNFIRRYKERGNRALADEGSNKRYNVNAFGWHDFLRAYMLEVAKRVYVSNAKKTYYWEVDYDFIAFVKPYKAYLAPNESFDINRYSIVYQSEQDYIDDLFKWDGAIRPDDTHKIWIDHVKEIANEEAYFLTGIRYYLNRQSAELQDLAEKKAEEISNYRRQCVEHRKKVKQRAKQIPINYVYKACVELGYSETAIQREADMLCISIEDRAKDLLEEHKELHCQEESEVRQGMTTENGYEYFDQETDNWFERYLQGENTTNTEQVADRIEQKESEEEKIVFI